MSPTTSRPAPVYVSIADLANRWGRCRKTARNATRAAGFPAPLYLNAGTPCWPIAEVIEWETQKRKPARKVVTGSLPQHHRGPADTTGWTKVVTRTVQAA